MAQTRDDGFLEIVQQRALCNPPTLRNTLELCERAINENVKGDFVECGVFAGAQCAVMARCAARDTKNVRLVHLFDSFEGIPHASERDDETITKCIGENQDGALVSTGVSVCSETQVKAHMREWGVDESLLRYHVGWFQNTVGHFAKFSARAISVLRLDGDLYESTKVCLSLLYPLVSVGGFVIIDDYALTGCKRAVRESRVFDGNPPPTVIEIAGGGHDGEPGPVWFQKR